MVRSIFTLRFFLYLLYGLLLTGVLLYVRFPAEKFKQFCEKRLEHYLPGTDCEIDRVLYRFPLSAVFEEVQITTPEENDQVDLTVGAVMVSAVPTKFFSGFSLDGDLLGGNLRADLYLNKREENFQLQDIELNNLDLALLGQSVGLGDRELSGTMEYFGSYQAESEFPLQGSGKGRVKVADGSMALLQPVLGLSAIEFSSVVMSVVQEQGEVTLAEGKVHGQDLHADFTGKIRLESPLLSSVLLLSGQLKPQTSFLRDNPREQKVVQRLLKRYKMAVLPFKVGGTVKRPLFRFSK